MKVSGRLGGRLLKSQICGTELVRVEMVFRDYVLTNVWKY